MSLVYTCPRCLTSQALVPNIMAPAPDGIYVECPACGAVAVHHPGPHALPLLQTWAGINAEVDVQMFARQLDRCDPSEVCR